MSGNTVRLHRVLATKPEKVYRAFLDPDALARWLPPNGFTGKVHATDPRVGGRYRMSFTNFSTGTVIGFGGEFLELVPHQKLRYTDQFDDPNLPGTITVTVTLKQVVVGTEIHIVQEGIPEVIPVEACYLGWQESLENLARLVVPEIPRMIQQGTRSVNGPDPVDGLRLALLQQRRELLRRRAAGRHFGVNEGLQLLMVLGGIGLLVTAVFSPKDRAQSIAVGIVLIVQGFFLWVMARSTAQHLLRQVDQQIEAESRRADAPVVAAAAIAARELLLKN